jgi:hypothetical protein
MPLAVNEQSEAIKALAREWPLLAALQGGTPAMRAARETLLPKWPGEEQASYDARLATATLFPAYRRTVGVMAGKPFAKALTLGDDVPARIKQWSENIDQHGVNLHAFAADVFEQSVVGYGYGGILVDYPDTVQRDPQGQPVARPSRTVAEVEQAGLRPYWVHIRHDQILGWQASLIGGVMTLTQLRLMESVEEPDGPYGTATVEQVRVLEPGKWALYRKPANGTAFELYREGTTTLRRIPFVPVYGRRQGFMLGAPPLLDLAYLNVKHWQSQSDQDTILHVARVPILCVTGMDEAPGLTVGAQTAMTLPINADMKYVEHSGASITAGAESLKDLEKQMIQTGAELLVKQGGDRSATESAGDQEANKCDLQRLAETFEDALDQALQFTAEFVGLPSGGSVSLFKDFGAATLTDATAQVVVAMQQGGLISKVTAINEMKRRGVLEAGVDPDVEIAQAEAEAPPPGDLMDAPDEDEAPE